MSFRAVLFDLGGVVLGSPMQAIAAFEEEHGIEAGFVNRHIAHTAPDGAWQKLERGELSVPEWAPVFAAECAERGEPLDASEMMAGIRKAAASPRPAMLRAIANIRERGLIAAALTNNWKQDGTALLRPAFDCFLESSKLGMRKPDPRIYQLACETMGVAPAEVVYLDDIGYNLKPAREQGMKTIKVDDPHHALTELATYLGFALG